MKMLLVVLVSLMFVACNSPEAENLKKENADLKTQLETMTKERDALRVQLDSIKAVLENAPSPQSSATVDQNANTTMPTNPDQSNSNPAAPDSGTSLTTPSNAPSTDGPAANATPDSGSGVSIAPDSNAAAANNPTSAVENYAKDVLETAQKYNSETQQTPPTDCSKGYTAGTHAVPASDAIESCRVDRLDKGFRVTLKDANGAVMAFPAP